MTYFTGAFSLASALLTSVARGETTADAPVAAGPVSQEVETIYDSHDNDITYFYAARLRGEPAAGGDDCRFHPVEPRQVRAAVRYNF